MVLAVCAIQAGVLGGRIDLGAVDVVAVGVASHEGQAGNAVGSHVQVIASLPGFLARTVEVRVLDGVGEEDRVGGGVVVAHAQIVERSVAVNILVCQGEGVSAKSIGGGQGEGIVVDIAGVGVAFILGFVVVEVEGQGLVVTDWQGVVQVAVVLFPDVLELRAIQGCAEVVGEGVPTADEVGLRSGHASVGGEQFTIVGGVIVTGARVEVTGFEVQAFDLAAHQADTAGGLRQQASAAYSEYRSLRLHVAEFQLGLGDADLACAAGLAEAVGGFAVVMYWQVAGAGTAFASVKFQAQVAESVDAEAYDALGVAGAVVGMEALSPVLTIAVLESARLGRICNVAAAIALVTVEVIVANQEVEAAVFDKAFSFGLIANEGFGHCHLAGCGGCGNRQGDGAPLHHFHCDCSFGFEVVCHHNAVVTANSFCRR
ncbi:hypothetical protein D3C78_514730 [compost metagenome]